MSTLIPGEHRRAVRIDDEPVKDVDNFMYLGSMFVANGQVTEEIRSSIYLARSAFSLWSWLYGCETWPVRVADERMLTVFDN